MPESVHPLVLEPIFKAKVWGGRKLTTLNKDLPDGEPIGESWEVADLDSTSASGGGGGAAHSRVAAGPLQGLTIREAIDRMGSAFAGVSKLGDSGAFPLLVKYLDAAQNLSVQVHPSPEYAAAHPEAHLKTESWYIVEAEPGSVIYKGIQPGIGPDRFREAIDAGTVEDCMIAVPVQKGDFHHLPSGTCHALGGGIVVAEVQTPSDTTFRVFDWGRTGRELHVEQSLRCIQFGPPARTEPIRSDGSTRCVFETNEHYEIAELRLDDPNPVPVPLTQHIRVWMCLGGNCTLAYGDEETQLDAGKTVVLPASLTAVVETHGPTAMLEAIAM